MSVHQSSGRCAIRSVVSPTSASNRCWPGASPPSLRQLTSQGGPLFWTRQHSTEMLAVPALEFLLATAARRGDAIRLGPRNIDGDSISFEQQKKSGTEDAVVAIPLHSDFQTALAAMPASNVLNLAPTFLTTARNRPFTAAGFGNWFRDRCREARLPAGISAHGLRKRLQGVWLNSVVRHTRLPR